MTETRAVGDGGESLPPERAIPSILRNRGGPETASTLELSASLANTSGGQNPSTETSSTMNCGIASSRHYGASSSTASTTTTSVVAKPPARSNAGGRVRPSLPSLLDKEIEIDEDSTKGDRSPSLEGIAYKTDAPAEPARTDDDDNNNKNTKRHRRTPLASLEVDVNNKVTDANESSRPTKRLRRHSHQSPSTRFEGHAVWNDFVRKGTSLKNLVEAAFDRVVAPSVPTATKSPEAFASSQDRRMEENAQEPRDDESSGRTPMMAAEHAAALAREKTAECMILQKKLQDATAHAAALSATNESLRESSQASSSRLERTVEALRIASANTAAARADADAAEAHAASLATQLQALRDVVDETKRACQALYKEHEQVSKAARVVEAKLVQRETEFARSQTKQRRLVEEKNELKAVADKFEEEHRAMEIKLQQQKAELQQRIKQAEERELLEQARKDRSSKLEKDLLDARSMLADSASAASEAEATTLAYTETIQGLQNENKSLHDRIEQLQESARTEHARLNEELGKVEKEAQSLRVRSASHDEAMQRVRADKSNSDKQVSQLKTRVANLERRLKEATALVPPSPDDSDSLAEDSSAARNSGGGVSFSIPKLQATTPLAAAKKSSTTASKVTPAVSKKSSTCCICSLPATGLMQSCKCGNPACDKRAHSNCVTTSGKAGPSVSHPGTPALRAPLVLCDNDKVRS